MSQTLASPHTMPTKTAAERAEGAFWRRLAFTVAVHIWAVSCFGFAIWKLSDTATVRVATATQEYGLMEPRGMAGRVSLQTAEAGR